ncbi:MAG: hypothetical protein V7608_1878 [Hyphomicrobiales bacterium]
MSEFADKGGALPLKSSAKTKQRVALAHWHIIYSVT